MLIKHNSYITKYIPHPRRSKRRRTRPVKKNTPSRRTAAQKAVQNATRHDRTRGRSARQPTVSPARISNSGSRRTPEAIQPKSRRPTNGTKSRTPKAQRISGSTRKAIPTICCRSIEHAQKMHRNGKREFLPIIAHPRPQYK